MDRAERRRNATAVALSIAAHAVVLTALALHVPTLNVPREEAGPPEPIIPILIMPRTPPAPPGAQAPAPIRLHRRQLRREVPPPPEIPPLIAPKEAPAPPPATKRPVQPRITVTPSPENQLTTALRGSVVGCANPELLTAAERDRCAERLGRGVREAPYIEPVVGGAKQADLDRAGQAKLERRREKEGGVPLGVAGGDSGASYRNKPLDTPILPPLRP